MNNHNNKALRLRGLTVVLMVLMIMACRPTVPQQYIQPDDMEDILYDFYVSKAVAYRTDNSNYKQNAYYYATLRKYGVSEAQFDSSLVYYYTHAEQLSSVYKNLSERIGDEAKSLGASVSDGEYANLSANGDTTDVWRDATTALLLPAPPYNRLDFELKGDTTYHRGDSFLFTFKTDFICQSGTRDAVAYVTITYDNDSVVVAQTRVQPSGQSQVVMAGNDNNDIKRIKGFVYLARGSEDNSGQKLLFLNKIRLIRFHKQHEEHADTLKASKGDSATTTKPDTARSKGMKTMRLGQTLQPLPKKP